MKFKDKQKWDQFVANNSSDEYSRDVVEFSERWANLMELRMDAGEGLEMRETCREADAAIGITGFQYGFAVAVLAEVWEHGEALRRQHNLDTQIGDEGVRANEVGTVLNPALISFQT